MQHAAAGIEVARGGRKKKFRGYLGVKEETPPERAIDDKVRTSRQPHRRVLRDEQRLSEKAESPIGRLNLRGVIDDDSYEAAVRFCAAVGAYRATIDAPRSTSGSGRGSACAIEGIAAIVCDPETCSCRAARDRYMRAFEALAACGQVVAKVVSRVAVHREEILPQQIVYLKLGLRALAEHYGLTARRRGEHPRNAH